MTKSELEQENAELREGLHQVQETISDLLDEESDEETEEEGSDEE